MSMVRKFKRNAYHKAYGSRMRNEWRRDHMRRVDQSKHYYQK